MIDYILVDQNLVMQVRNFRIDSRIKSDYMPLIFKTRSKRNGKEKKVNRK